MTNLERFRLWTRHLKTPDTYINFSWYFTILSSLQRRVWIGKLDGDPLFPNIYIIPIGTSGVGKGLVIGKVNELLRFHKRAPKLDTASQVQAAINQTNYIFPPGPNDCTYEKICHKLAESIYPHKWKNCDGKERIYSHSSMCIVLEELGSLFKRRENKGLSTLLLQLYDCKDYDYETQTRGQALIRKPCLSILGGCTPRFLPEGIQKGILEDGTVSRMIFIFETQPRRSYFFLGQPGEEELVARDHLLDHILSLSKLYGPVNFDSGVVEYLENWNATTLAKKISNAHSKMESYYARIQVHIQKLAMAVHFSDKLDMTLTLDDFKTAIAELETIEDKMSIGFSAAGRNTYSVIAKDIMKYIDSFEGEWVSVADILGQFSSELTYAELDRQLLELVIMDRLIEKDGKYACKH